MKKALLFLFLSSGLMTIQALLPAEIDTVKQQIQERYDKEVEEEKIKFLNHYRLSLQDLNNQEVVRGLKQGHDTMCQEALKQHSSSIQENPDELKIVQEIAGNVFKELDLGTVTVIPNNEFEAEDICIYQIYSSTNCYVTLNCAKHADNLEQLEAALKHECSHIVHQDNFYKELMQCLGWANSQDSHQEVGKQSYPFSRAFETRADVYAALHSSDHGRSLIQFLGQSTENPDILTHPPLSERITVLEEVKQLLDNAVSQVK